MPRDSQRQKLYDAERAAFGEFITDNRDFTEIRDVQKFVNRVVKRKWWKEMGGPSFVHAKPGNRTWARAEGGYRITLPPAWAFNKAVILHELSHILLTHIHRHKVADHGPEFVWIYRKLVELILGENARRTLDHECDSRNVKNSATVRMLYLHNN